MEVQALIQVTLDSQARVGRVVRKEIRTIHVPKGKSIMERTAPRVNQRMIWIQIGTQTSKEKMVKREM